MTVTFSSIWKKGSYILRGQGSNIFLSEDIGATQHAIFFKCRELRCEKNSKSTWTEDLRIWIRGNNDQKTEITTEADLNFLIPPPPPPPAM